MFQPDSLLYSLRRHCLCDKLKNIFLIDFIFVIHINQGKTMDAFKNQHHSWLNMLIFAFWLLLRWFFKLELSDLAQLECLTMYNYINTISFCWKCFFNLLTNAHQYYPKMPSLPIWPISKQRGLGHMLLPHWKLLLSFQLTNFMTIVWTSGSGDQSWQAVLTLQVLWDFSSCHWAKWILLYHSLSWYGITDSQSNFVSF